MVNAAELSAAERPSRSAAPDPELKDSHFRHGLCESPRTIPLWSFWSWTQDFQPAELTANLTDAGYQVGLNQMITVGPKQIITLRVEAKIECVRERGSSFQSPGRPR